MVSVGHALFTDVKRLSAVEHGPIAARRAWVSPSTLVWHDLGERSSIPRPPHKLPELIRYVHHFAATHHCPLPVRALPCHTHVACSGARWRRCKQTFDATNCSSALHLFMLPPAEDVSNMERAGLGSG